MLKEARAEPRTELSGAHRSPLPTTKTTQEPSPATVAHAMDFYHRYPGEVATFFTRVETRELLSDLTLRIAIPKGLVLGDFRPPTELEGKTAYVEVDEETHYLVLSLEGELPAGTCFECQTDARVAPTLRDVDFESRATLTTEDHQILAEETVTLAVMAKGGYLRCLPELYEQDEFMGRFLMLFESFWAPIEKQVGSICHYFDPRMTPVGFLPWLASWLGLVLDERFPEERRRQLIRSAVWLYRRRGTPSALKEYLEIYASGRVRIIEHRAQDFRLGPENKLGPGVALGTGNRPHTFTVVLNLPPAPDWAGAQSGEKDEQRRLESERLRAIRGIIDAYKPAHTDYTLRIETLAVEGQALTLDKKNDRS